MIGKILDITCPPTETSNKKFYLVVVLAGKVELFDFNSFEDLVKEWLQHNKSAVQVWAFEGELLTLSLTKTNDISAAGYRTTIKE